MKIKRVQLLRYGKVIAHNESRTDTSNSVTGYFLHSDEINLVEQTDILKGSIGLSFGIEYYLEGYDSEVKYEEARFTCRIIHPQIRNPDTGVSVTETTEVKYNYLNENNHDYFTMEYDYEVRQGTWTFEIIENSTVLLRKSFTII
ncbi:DUF3859 domain-containing protein [Mucilaginibacter lacusdianchii]|uniref:DUF3859 domain-containing protein n=1 Tax=Mucilaginibacter lacusdianchii TaxID=2684211 RepID=UPI00131B428B|nr:DUF3859 domain-containing protein [Mucilaginibacter sp. JXJ CY 39]